LYQVAIAALSPADIAEPLRRALGKQRNVEVVLREVTDIDTQGQQVLLQDLAISYDYLIVATGAQYNYFGHDEWRQRQKERANWREPLALSQCDLQWSGTRLNCRDHILP
jgi:NADH dehydrogenase FAD-containing subunit